MHLTIRLYNFHEPSNLACIVQITIHSRHSNTTYDRIKFESPFSRYPSWEVGGVDLSPLFFLASGLSPHTGSSIFTISSQSCFLSHAESYHLSGIFCGEKFTLSEASLLDATVPHWTPDVCGLCPPRVLVDDWEVAWGRELNAQPPVPVPASTAQSKRA